MNPEEEHGGGAALALIFVFVVYLAICGVCGLVRWIVGW